MEINIDDDRIGRTPRRPSLFSRVIHAIVVLVSLGLFAAVTIVIFIGGDPQTLKRLALGTVWPSAAHDFRKVYASLAIDDIPARDFDTTINDGLLKLEDQPCNRHAMVEVGKALVKKKQIALAAQAYLGFTQSCHQNEYTEREAGRLVFSIGDYQNARALFSDLVDRFPQYDNDWYYKGQREAALGQRSAALESYASTIALTNNQAALREAVFTEMAALYAAEDRFCEAMAPIEAYVAIAPQQRDTPRTRQLIDGYSRRGRCASYASVSDTFPIFGSGVIRLRASIDGVVGTFLIDTGASFVAVTEAFAVKAGLKTDETHVGNAVTANGEARVRLSRAATIRLGRVQAADIAVVVLGKSLGTADGLLGRSFLSRFDMTIAGDHLSLRSKG